MPGWGICEIREFTDKECERMNRKGINWAPISMGFVNCFQADKFMGWCGVAFAKRHLVGGLKRQKLPKIIRDIPI
jgi:hypothetical protein